MARCTIAPLLAFTSATIALKTCSTSIHLPQLPRYTLHCVTYLLSSVHIRACLEQHPNHLHMPFQAGNVEGSSRFLQHSPTETQHGPLQPTFSHCFETRQS